MSQNIIAISGRKHAGKDTCYKFLESILTCDRVQRFAFADPLKRMCIDILGIPEECAYGTEEQKNTLVPHLLWQYFPVPVFDMPDGGVFVGAPGYWDNDTIGQRAYWPPDGVYKQGPMTVREVLQYWGSEIFRRAYHSVWADACIRAIRKSDCELAIIVDCRFPNEVDAVQQAGGWVIRLTRVVYPQDTHVSETSLDTNNFDYARFDAIISNQAMNIYDQSMTLYHILRAWEVLDYIPEVHLLARRAA